MAATEEKHFSECLHLINEVMERTRGWLLSRTLLPSTFFWRISNDRNASANIHLLWRVIFTKLEGRPRLLELPIFPAGNIQVKDKFFSPPLNYWRQMLSLCPAPQNPCPQSWYFIWHVLGSSFVKNPPAMQETPVQFLGREDPLEKG